MAVRKKWKLLLTFFTLSASDLHEWSTTSRITGLIFTVWAGSGLDTAALYLLAKIKLNYPD